jgi:hexosaminidase
VVFDGPGLGAVLTAAGSVADLVDAPLLNGSALFTALFAAADPPAVEPDRLAEAGRALSAAADTLARARPAVGDGAVAVRETAQAIALACFAVALLAAGGVARLTAETATDLLASLDELLVEQRACWLLSARPGGLDDSIAKFAPLRSALARRAAQ